MNCIFAELETQAMDVFREYLKDKKYRDIERFFNEWKMTFQSVGPFNTEQDLQLVREKMTKPDDFMVSNVLFSSSSSVTLEKVKLLDVSRMYPFNNHLLIFSQALIANTFCDVTKFRENVDNKSTSRKYD